MVLTWNVTIYARPTKVNKEAKIHDPRQRVQVFRMTAVNIDDLLQRIMIEELAQGKATNEGTQNPRIKGTVFFFLIKIH